MLPNDGQPWSLNPSPDYRIGQPERGRAIATLARVRATAVIQCSREHPLHAVYADEAAKDRTRKGDRRRWDVAKMPVGVPPCALASCGVDCLRDPDQCNTVMCSSGNYGGLQEKDLQRSDAPANPFSRLTEALSNAIRTDDSAAYRAARIALTNAMLGRVN